MPQLYIAAAVTSLVAVCMFTALIFQLTSQEHRRKLLYLGCLGLCISPLAYFCVRIPLIKIVEPTLLGTSAEKPNGTASAAVLGGVRLLYAPLTEEPAKLLPWIVLLMLGVWQRPPRELVVPLALTVGVAFAIGEFWLVAYLISAKPDPVIAQLPWYAFRGYISERLMTCFAHTLFALPTVLLYRRSTLLASLGLLTGMILHYVSNAPIVLMHQQAFGLSAAVWSAIAQVWLVLFVVVTLFVLVAVHYGNEVVAKIWQNKMICPECGATYRQPIAMGLNMGAWRYEPCGACHKWHWVTIKNLAPLEKSETIETSL